MILGFNILSIKNEYNLDMFKSEDTDNIKQYESHEELINEYLQERDDILGQMDSAMDKIKKILNM